MNGGIYPELHRPTVGQQMLLDDETVPSRLRRSPRRCSSSGIGVTWGTRREMDEDEIGEMWASMDERGGVALMHDLLHYVADRREHEERWRGPRGLDLPMTFVWGDLDPVSGAHMIERVEERMPGRDRVRMADVGHWPLLEAPDVLAPPWPRRVATDGV